MHADALQLTGDFSIDALAFRSVAVPDPGPDEVLLRVRAVSLNYRDLMVLRGHYNPRVQKPLTLCSDGAGEVVATGANVRGLQVGDRAVASFFLDWNEGTLQQNRPWSSAVGEAQQGMLTTHRVLPSRALVKIPEALTFEQASTLPCAGVTAWNALTQFQPLTGDSTVLLQGTGGVSIFGLQIARALGARVLLTSSSQQKLQRGLAMGATEGIDYRAQPEWDRAVRELTGKRGATHILEVGGAQTLALSLLAAAPGALIAIIGVLSGTEQPLNILPVLMQGLQLQGIYVGSTAMLREVAEFFAAHNLSPVIDAVFPFDRATDAFRALESATHFGKLVIRMPQ